MYVLQICDINRFHVAEKNTSIEIRTFAQDVVLNMNTTKYKGYSKESIQSQGREGYFEV